jgi:cytochrome c6
MQIFKLFMLLFCFFENLQFTNIDLEKGEKLFSLHCVSCHAGGSNIIIPEKNLKKETLETFGINNRNSIIYQIINGKNGMPAFGGRLKKIEIEQITSYLLN